MADSKQLSQQETRERRRPERRPLDGEVVVEFSEADLVGPGQNISEAGVFFVTEGSIPVSVRVEGREGLVAGQLVRVESMGAGKLGIAIKFDD